MPICLPDANVTLTKECWIAGFGETNKSKIIMFENHLDNFPNFNLNKFS